jgi:hypothetical protein
MGKPRLVLSMGGTLEGNAHARADAWEKTIEFFKKLRTSVVREAADA